MSAGRAAAAIGAALCLVPIWASGHLPMVDLAQHAAQIALWTHRDDPLFFPPDVYRFHWFTPYLGAYVLARAFAALFGVATALKLTVSVAAAAVPLSAAVLLKVTRGDGWWAVAAAPLAFGVSFYSGFLNFMLAIPVAILLIAAVLRFESEPSPRNGTWIALASFSLAFCHALAFAVGGFVAAAAIVGSSSDLRTKFRGGLFLAAPFPVVAAWALTVWLGEAHVRTPIRWTGLPSRLYRTPAALVGSPEAAIGLAALVLVLGALVLLGVRMRSNRAVLAALGAAGLFYLTAPDAAFHTVVLPERFPALLAILLLTLLRMPEAPRARRGVVALLLVLATAWTAHLALRFRGFDREMAGFDRILEKTEPGKVLRLVAFDQTSRAVPGYPLFWNAGAWYQVRKGGFVGFSFSQLFPVLVRYRETPPWAEPLWTKRDAFEWRDVDREVDYFVFRGQDLDPRGLFPRGPYRPRPVAREGEWWLFAKPPI